MAAMSLTLNDHEGHSQVAGLFKCNLSIICAAFYIAKQRRKMSVGGDVADSCNKFSNFHLHFHFCLFRLTGPTFSLFLHFRHIFHVLIILHFIFIHLE